MAEYLPLKGKSLDDFAKAGYTPLIVGRVSSPAQLKGLPVQMEQLAQYAKDKGFKKKPVLIQAQQSGKGADLETINQMMSVLDTRGKTRYLVLFFDMTRMGRLSDRNIKMGRELFEKNVPIAVFEQGRVVNSTRPDLLVFGMLSVSAEFAKSGEEEGRKRGQADAAARGLTRGSPIDLYPEKMKNGMTLYARINSSIPALDAGTISRRALAKKLGMFPQKTGQIVEKLKLIEAKGGKKKKEEYLQVVKAIVELEKQRSVGSRARKPASNRTKRSLALHRVTNTYLSDPFFTLFEGTDNEQQIARPDTAGNPSMATQPDVTTNATGTIYDAVENFGWYMPKK